MKTIYYLFGVVLAAVCCTSCNNEWEDEQFHQLVSFNATLNDNGVSPLYIRYNAGGTVTYDLPIIMSGSTMNTHDRLIHVALDKDTMDILNQEQYGNREELYYQLLNSQYYSFEDTVTMPAGQCVTTMPIKFTLGGTRNSNPLDLTEKWMLPLTIVDDPAYDYQSNPQKHYGKALLEVSPFNDYSGTYSATQYKIYLEGQSTAFTTSTSTAYVHDDETIFLYAGMRNVDYLDRHKYKVYVRFTNERIDLKKRKVEIWSDNADPATGNAFQIGANESYYTMSEEMDAVQPYMKHVYITLYLNYTFEDYTTSPGIRMKYTVDGTLSLQRNLNTLIPDEDQQIQWN